MKLLKEVCELLGIQRSYESDQKKKIEIAPDVLGQMVHLLSGWNVESENGLKNAHRMLRAQRYQSMVPASLVAWDGKLPRFPLTLPARLAGGRVRVAFQNQSFDFELADLKATEIGGTEPGEEKYFVFEIPWARGFSKSLEFGIWPVTVELDSEVREFPLISAPRRLEDENPSKMWGVFTPMYAIRSRGDFGIGGLGEMEMTQEFIARRGGHFVGTLPLLATSGDQKTFDPSPYSPSSRLFWNEIYLDPLKIARDFGGGDADLEKLRQDVIRLKETASVDHLEVYRTKRGVLDRWSKSFFEKNLEKTADFQAYLRDHPEAEAYAEFRQQSLKAGPDERNFHLFAQYQMHRQLLENRERAGRGEIANLYLDFPVGVSRSGFDAQHFKDAFLGNATIGAPPDTFFAEGQSWGLVPLHPQGLRKDNFRYWTESLRNHFRYASLLRLDHAMALHRLFVIPEGASAKDGAYVEYPSEDLYAILNLEAYRHNASVIGEDLGTVPPIVREKMSEHNLKRMWIFELEYLLSPEKSWKEMPEESLAALNTHDLPPFEKFWQEAKADPANKKKLELWLKSFGLSHPEKVKSSDVLELLTREMAASKAKIFLMSLEDLWGETDPQNKPGVVDDQNWRKKNRLSFEEWTSDPKVLKFFEIVREVRA